MALLRHLTVAHSSEPTNGRSIRVAFASTDGECVDQHLAVASRFAVFSVAKSTIQHLGIGEFTTRHEGDDGGKLGEKVAWLSACDVVYAVAVGSTASLQLMARGVLPLRTPKGTNIKSVLLGLQEELDDRVADWLEEILRFKEDLVVSQPEFKSERSQES